MKCIFFTLGICNMPAIRSSKHKTKIRAEGTEEFYHLLCRNTTRNQTKQAHSQFCSAIGLCSTVRQSLKAETQFISPHVPSKQAWIRTKELSCYIRKCMTLKDNSPQGFQFSSENTTNANNANSEQYFTLGRMLYSLHEIKISQKNTLEKIFSCGCQKTFKL